MKRNPVIPYAIIAVLGILTMIVLAMIGLNQQEQIAGGGEETEEVRDDPEQIAQSCIVCHGADLSGGGSAPSLENVGSKYTEEEILDIILNGIPGTLMPGGQATGEEAEILAAWLAERE